MPTASISVMVTSAFVIPASVHQPRYGHVTPFAMRKKSPVALWKGVSSSTLTGRDNARYTKAVAQRGRVTTSERKSGDGVFIALERPLEVRIIVLKCFNVSTPLLFVRCDQYYTGTRVGYTLARSLDKGCCCFSFGHVPNSYSLTNV